MKSGENNNDMSVLTGKGLNVTGVKAKNLKGTEVEENLETFGEESFSLQTITEVHQFKKQEIQKKQAFGTSQNIFDVSDYGEVRLNNLRANSNTNSMYMTNQKGGEDASISLVQMGDSMNMNMVGGLNQTKSRSSEQKQEDQCSANDSQLTGNFEKDGENMVNQSGAHYMNELARS